MHEEISCPKCCDPSTCKDHEALEKLLQDPVFMKLVSVEEKGPGRIGLYRCPWCGHEESVFEV